MTFSGHCITGGLLMVVMLVNSQQTFNSTRFNTTSTTTTSSSTKPTMTKPNTNSLQNQIEYHMVDLLQDLRGIVSRFEAGEGGQSLSASSCLNGTWEEVRHEFEQLERRLDQRIKQVETRFDEIPTMVIRELATKLQCLLHQPECLSHLHCGKHTDGLYGITPPGRPSQSVYCDMTTLGGGWTIIQKRVDNSTDFNRNFNEYQAGFGNPDGNFWLGLDSIHALTDPEGAELFIHLEKLDGETAYAMYNHFHVADADRGYRITVNGYSGTAGNSFKKLQLSRSKFSAKDRDQDNYHGSCAAAYKSGWWFNNCFEANLNGLYHPGKLSTAWQGIIWYHYTGLGYSLPRVHMMIRKRQIANT